MNDPPTAVGGILIINSIFLLCGLLFYDRTLLDGQFTSAAPILKRTIINMRVVAKIASNEVEQTSLLSDVTIGSHTATGFYISLAEQFSQCCGGLESVISFLNETGEGNVLRFRNMAAAWHSTLFLPGVELRRARIEDANVCVIEIVLHPRRIDN